MNIAYHWNRKARPILCMPIGIAFTAAPMSLMVAGMPFDCERISASSASDGGTSLVRVMAMLIVTKQQTAPSQKQMKTQYGTLDAVAPWMNFWNTNRDRLAKTAPAPVNKLWVRKPRGIWLLRSRSEISAR